jgi:hypothetical protein
MRFGRATPGFSNLLWKGNAMLKMIRICLIPGILLSLGLCSGCANPEKKEARENVITIDFTHYDVGKLPDGFSTAVTNGGQPGTWEIIDARGTKVLAQTSTDETDGRFPLCLYDKASIKNVEVSADFMAVAGKVDQAAGLVARYKDKDNYYITRANALEDNLRLYKVESGKRKQIANATLKVTSGTWHTLKLEIEGTHLTVSCDGKSIIDADDATFQDAGKVGFWTKADSVTYFKNLKIENK